MLNFLITQVPRYIYSAGPLFGDLVPQAPESISKPMDLYVVVNGYILPFHASW
jgi:hypothetical protein